MLSMIDLPAHPHWVAVRAEVDARIEQLAEQRRLALMCWTSLRTRLEDQGTVTTISTCARSGCRRRHGP